MSTDEIQIIEFLKQYPESWVCPMEISKKAGGRRRFTQDPYWARPVILRLEDERLVESNVLGHVKIMAHLLENAAGSLARRQKEHRYREAIRTYIIRMNPADDHKTFPVLLCEAIGHPYVPDKTLFD